MPVKWDTPGMEGKIAGHQRHGIVTTEPERAAVSPPSPVPAGRDERLASASRLAATARICAGVFGVLAILGYAGSVVALLSGAMMADTAGYVLGASLAVGVTVSLLPTLMLCRWAQAYAADLTWRRSTG